MVLVLLNAYRFLSIRMTTSPIAMIAIIDPAPMPSTYVSVIGAGVGVGAGVASGAFSTLRAVTADDGQYDSDPAKVAYTVYFPGTSGVNVAL